MPILSGIDSSKEIITMDSYPLFLDENNSETVYKNLNKILTNPEIKKSLINELKMVLKRNENNFEYSIENLKGII